MRRLLTAVPAALWLSACSLFQVDDDRDHEPPAPRPPLHASALASTSWDVCRLLGPAVHDQGIYGTDLGYTAPLPGTDRLALLFGDTWSESGDACQYPVTPADDLQASLPRARPAFANAGPPSADAKAQTCSTIGYALDDASDPKSWRRMRLFATPEDLAAGRALESGGLRTPVAVWNTQRDRPEAQLYALFHRSDLAPCANSGECPRGMLCSNDTAQGAVPLGRCTQPVALGEEPIPQLCRNDDDCGTASTCDMGGSAVCTTDAAFTLDVAGERVSPAWYRDDPRLGAAHTMYVARSVSRERPEDYLVEHRFVTRRFINAAARTVAFFDPVNPAANDYRPGDHTLLLWGRPAFVSTQGEQSLPFLLYVPLAELTDPQAPRWSPRFFAGYERDGRPRWSDSEQDAVPIYGGEAELLAGKPGRDGDAVREDKTRVLAWREPEFDYVNQMSVTFVEPLQRFVMFYGGDVPAWLVMDADGKVKPPVHVAPAPGAIHQRSARHPWGRAFRDDADEDAWSSAQAVLTREAAAPYLACGSDEEQLPGCSEEGDEHNPLDLLETIAEVSAEEPSDALDVTAQCVEGQAALATQTAVSGDPVGRLYGTAIIEEWTADVSAQSAGLQAGERAVELYWNVSTWNPYQVVLMKTELRGRP